MRESLFGNGFNGDISKWDVLYEVDKYAVTFNDDISK